MAVVDAAFGLLISLVVPLTLGGYWLAMRDARAGAGLAGFVLGIGLGLPGGKPVALGVGVVTAVVAGAVAHHDDRFGWAVAAGATGVLLAPFAMGGIGVVAVSVAAVLTVALGALAWRFPRGTLPVSTSVHGGLAVVVVFAGDAADGGVFAVGSNTLLAGVILSAFVGLMVQPWTAELGDTVPPLLPLTIRNWFDLVPEGGVDDALCPNCGEAVDVPCPECGERPIEEASTGVGLLGLVVFYRWRSRTVVGCHECNRSRLWTLAGKNTLLGWWSVTALVNPFVILWNLGRGAVNRGPNKELARTLAESGVDFDYLADPAEFDPEGQADHELLLRGLLRLGVAVMLADGDADRREAAAIRDSALEPFPDQASARIEDRIQQYASGTTNASRVATGLAATLTGDGRALALRFAAEVAVADGDVDDREARLLATIADELGLSDGAVEAAICSGVSTEDASSPASAV